MADIVKKTAVPVAEWDPVRAMRDLLRWDPFREMAAFDYAAFEAPAFNPSFEVTENQEGYFFKADVPGVKKEDIEITTTGNRLQISGKRESEQEVKKERIYTYERQYGSFARAFTLPEGAELASARSDLKDGVLTLFIPKKPGAQPKKIEISSPTAKS